MVMRHRRWLLIARPLRFGRLNRVFERDRLDCWNHVMNLVVRLRWYDEIYLCKLTFGMVADRV